MNTNNNEVPERFVLLERENGQAKYAACFDGGRFHGWLMQKHTDGQWVSVRKLESWEVMQAEDQGHYGIVHETQAPVQEPKAKVRAITVDELVEAFEQIAPKYKIDITYHSGTFKRINTNHLFKIFTEGALAMQAVANKPSVAVDFDYQLILDSSLGPLRVAADLCERNNYLTVASNLRALAKNLPSLCAAPVPAPDALAAIKTLQHLNYTYHGGELWEPPLGKLVGAQDKLDAARNAALEEAAQICDSLEPACNAGLNLAAECATAIRAAMKESK